MSFHEQLRRARRIALGRTDKPAEELRKKAVRSPAEKQASAREIKQKVKGIARARQERKAGSNSRGVFKTIPFDPTDKIQVRIDSKTIVYAKPGADIEALKAKYRKLPVSKKDFEDPQPPKYQF